MTLSAATRSPRRPAPRRASPPYACVLDGVAMRYRGNARTWAARMEALMGLLRKPMFPVYALNILVLPAAMTSGAGSGRSRDARRWVVEAIKKPGENRAWQKTANLYFLSLSWFPQNVNNFLIFSSCHQKCAGMP
jgi:hypothetical protein